VDAHRHIGRRLDARLLQGALLIVAAVAGFLLASKPHAADAIGPPLPTVPSSSLPLPVPLPSLPSLSSGATTTTAAATTTTATGNPATGDPSPTFAPAPPATPAGKAQADSAAGAVRTQRLLLPAGALRLGSGAVSIPLGSVRPPARLRLSVTVSPRLVRRPAEPVKATVLVRDTRGYLVRGALVALSSGPAAKPVRLAATRSASDGRAAFVARFNLSAFRPGSVRLLVSAGAAPKATARLGFAVLFKPARA